MALTLDDIELAQVRLFEKKLELKAHSYLYHLKKHFFAASKEDFETPMQHLGQWGRYLDDIQTILPDLTSSTKEHAFNLHTYQTTSEKEKDKSECSTIYET